MRTDLRTDPIQRYPDWLPRAIVSGFAASVAIAILFFLAYGFARAAANIELSPRPGSPTFNLWMEALTNNRVLDLASSSVYAAAVLHLFMGVLWALAYAYAFEPRLPGSAQAKGVTFALIPWILSLVVFLPLVGGGFLGLDIGAGPLPAIGNLILHLERDAPEVADHYEVTAARGIVIGALLGLAVGVAALVFNAGPELVEGGG